MDLTQPAIELEGHACSVEALLLAEAFVSVYLKDLRQGIFVFNVVFLS